MTFALAQRYPADFDGIVAIAPWVNPLEWARRSSATCRRSTQPATSAHPRDARRPTATGRILWKAAAAVLFDRLAGTPVVLGNPTVIRGVGVTLRYPVRKA